MGKASRKKKERKAAGKLQGKEPVKKGSPQKGVKSQKPGKKAQKATPKKKATKKITIAALEKKAAAVDTALKKAVERAEGAVAGKEEHSLKDHISELKMTARKGVDNFKKGIDPDKFKTLKKETKIILKKGGYSVAGILAVVAIIMVIELHSAGRVFPGTTAGGIDVSYLPVNEAQEKIEAEIAKYMGQPLIFSYEGDTFEVLPEEIDLQVAAEQTIARLPVFEFEKENPVQLAATLFINRSISSDYALNGDKTIKVLEDKLQLGDKKAKNARLVYGEEGFVIEPEREGIAINRETLIKAMQKNINSLGTDTIAVEMIEQTPRITAAKLEKEKDHLIGLLDKPITLQTEESALTVKLIEHLEAVTFEEESALTVEGQGEELPLILGEEQLTVAHAEPVEIKSNIQIQVDPEKMQEHLYENLIKDIETPVSPANIYTNEEGGVIIEGTGEDGRSVPVERLTSAIALAANNGIDTVPVPVLIDKAPLTISEDLQEKGIKDLIATGHSAYYGSPGNRMFNIEFGSAKYNGMLIAPGEEFSFNEHLGEVDAGSGFKPEKVIKKNKLELEYGGGICQVSTTMYRAALQAGLPITQRKPHSWKVSYYGQSMGHGLDATIYPGVSDLKFLNDTPGHLLIQAYTDGAEDYFKFYGTDDGRVTEMDGPYGGGLTYRWNRTVKKDGEEKIAEEIWSRYVPIPPPDPKPEPKAIAQTPAPVTDGF